MIVNILALFKVKQVISTECRRSLSPLVSTVMCSYENWTKPLGHVTVLGLLLPVALTVF